MAISILHMYITIVKHTSVRVFIYGYIYLYGSKLKLCIFMH